MSSGVWMSKEGLKGPSVYMASSSRLASGVAVGSASSSGASGEGLRMGSIGANGEELRPTPPACGTGRRTGFGAAVLDLGGGPLGDDLASAGLVAPGGGG